MCARRCVCGRAAAQACNGVIPGAVTRCWDTSLLMLIPELYSPVVGCESLLTLPKMIFKPGALPSQAAVPAAVPLQLPVCAGAVQPAAPRSGLVCSGLRALWLFGITFPFPDPRSCGL